MSSNKKDDGKNERREDPFKRILSEFERMSRSIDDMMRKEMDRKTMESSFNDFGFPQPEEGQTISFSFSIEQGPEGILIKPTQSEVQPQRTPKENEERMTDIIEKENHVDVLMETNTEDDSKVEAELLNEGEIEITSPEGIKRIKLPCNVGKIEEKSFKNGVLQVKLSKKDQDA